MLEKRAPNIRQHGRASEAKSAKVSEWMGMDGNGTAEGWDYDLVTQDVDIR